MPIIGEKSSGGGRKLDYYLKWKGASDAGKFVTWDWEAEVDYNLDEFIIIKTGYAIKGYSDKHNKQIYSNQIDAFTEELNVRAGEDEIVKGIYRDIKDKIEGAGGKLHILLTCLTNSGEVVQVPLKGKAFANFLSFSDTNDTSANKVKFAGAEDGKKWAIKFRTPLFEVGSQITPEELEQAKGTAKEIFSGNVDENQTSLDDVEIKEEDLPF